jgi:phospholipid/cholesterol/gamma-HCH transport system substrate-binding protein
MIGQKLIETIMGGVVLLVAGFFLVFAYTHADLREVKGYPITAHFSNVAGVDRGADVRINGIKVGTIATMGLDPQTFTSVVTLSIRDDIHLPDDTVGSIASDGLLGGKYIRLEPGRSTKLIEVGGGLTKTRDFKSIEEMVGNLIFLATAETPKASEKSSEGSSTPKLEEIK